MSTSTRPRELFRDPPRRSHVRRGLAASLALALGVTGVSASAAATKVTETNKNQLEAVGPVNSKYGFPAWYEDKTGTRLELCDDGGNPLCGLAPEEGFDPEQPLALPGNFPHEIFYMLAGSELDLPGGGSAVLTLGLEAAFGNEVAPGEQMVFARQRLVVKDGPANSTLSFPHPYGTIEVDTDAEGNAKLVEDIAPAVGNFTTPLGSNLGPFLKWDTGAPAGYLGNPDVPHRIVGGLRNTFSMTGTNSATGAAVSASTDLFTVQGKIATNTGVKAEQAVVNDGFLDVFATSRGDVLEVSGQNIPTTPLEKAPGDSELAYARIQLNGAAPSEVTVTNRTDDPQSTSTVSVSDVSIPTAATYDGTKLTVTAKTSPGSTPKVVGVKGFDGTMVAGADSTHEGSYETVAPPVHVTVETGSGKATVPVVVTGGEVSPAAVPAPPEGENPGPVTETEGGAGGGTGTPADDAEKPTAAVAALSTSVARAVATELDGSGSTDNVGVVRYEWSQKEDPSAPKVTFDRTDVAKPKVTVPFFTTAAATAPKAPDTDPVLQLVVMDAAGNRSDPVTITLKSDDTVTAAAASRHRVGKEIRLSGTAVVAGAPTLLNPVSSVNIYNTSTGTPVKIASAPVDTLGNWEYRAKPGPGQRVSSILVESTRGGTAKGVVAAG
ncbi:UNVERIFIED_CONTAM: hypothetical protein RF653_06190 [Kocuria sp. CPCC 205316]|uniref:hypothetical protein n=1 Tax=Kocuria TaxID=57493 RepID=UPI0036DAECD5